MKDRIRSIMEREGMTQQAFAAALSISAASLSSIFTGRTNPTANHVQAIHRTFPKISTNWLMFGEGDMYEEGGRETLEQLADELAGTASDEKKSDSESVAAPKAQAAAQTIPIYIERPVRKITEIRIFFDDGTYETFSRNSDKN